MCLRRTGEPRQSKYFPGSFLNSVYTQHVRAEKAPGRISKIFFPHHPSLVTPRFFRCTFLESESALRGAHILMFLTRGARVCRGGEKAKDCLACWNNWDQDQVTGDVKFHREQNKKFDAILRPHVMWWWPGYYVIPFMRTDVAHKLQRYISPFNQNFASIH